ncbi:hypothetical protein MKX33_00720 [Paenibacillus sp. FSL R5-0490]|uniref:hypothetical protein n=1 Tax=Paenibacillus sp. FSL R5-0490 TaxID=1920424 RepID=UPI0030CB3F19
MEHLKTGMYVEVDGVTVSYGKVLNQFCPAGWYGIIYYIQTSWQEGQEKHAAIVEKMVRQFEEQSYDHGSEWVEQRREIIQQDKMSQISIVSFRIRDIH